jgi:CrcB protein
MTNRHPTSGGVSLLAGAAGLGGAVGALARWGLTEAFPVSTGHFPWVVLVINVSGSALLAALPLLPVARRVPWVAVFLGTGILGGYTTMSAASVDTFTLLDEGHLGLAMAYCLGTLAAALAAVMMVERWSRPEERLLVERAGGDE